MITNQNNYDYSVLFAKANKTLQLEPEYYITSMNDYFAAIADLAKLDIQYTRLPLDEEPFEINANTREIIVPDAFKKGVGVQGDQVAEIIYFRIDRYFDATDLYNQKIFIQWENAKGEKGLSREYIKDVESDPDHIIFGWPLAKEITEYAGTVKFSVRFYQTGMNENGEEELIYSFATQPQAIMINQTMDFNLFGNDIQVLDAETHEMIMNRFQNSEPDNTGSDIEAPNIVADLVEGEYDIGDNDNYDHDPSSYSLLLSATARSARVDYYLSRKEPAEKDWPTATGLLLDPAYLPTKDQTYNENKMYYIEQEENGVVAMQLLNGASDFDYYVGNTEIFEKYGIAKITGPGQYRIKARARRGLHSQSTSYSKIVTFPYPETPVLITNHAVLLDEDNKCQLAVQFENDYIPTGTLTYSWLDNKGVISGATNSILQVEQPNQEDVTYTVKVINNRNGASTTPVLAQYRVTRPAQVPTIISLPAGEISLGNVGNTITLKVDVNVPKDSISVQWYKSTDATIGEGDSLIGAAEAITDTGVSTLTPTTGGYYYAKVYLTYNTDTKEAISGIWSLM